jgi:transposase-like protein
MAKKRRQYTAEFKREAVGLVTEHGYIYAEAGRSLGITGIWSTAGTGPS